MYVSMKTGGGVTLKMEVHFASVGASAFHPVPKDLVGKHRAERECVNV